MRSWNDDEVKSLFSLVEEHKNASKPLRSAFFLHAQKFERKPNSVRNFYYQEVENLKKDRKKSISLGIVIEKHTKNHFVPFSDAEEDALLSDIERLVKNGMSVRTACQNLSGGDLKVMTRLQNKFQNLKKKKADNIIVFKQRQKVLTDNDLNSLLLGLVKLIKKSAVDEYVEKTKLEKDSSAFLLKKAFVDLSKKDKQIGRLQEDFVSLKKENESLREKLESLAKDKTQLLRAHLGNKQRAKLAEKLK